MILKLSQNLVRIIEFILEAFIWLFVWELIVSFKGPHKMLFYMCFAFVAFLLLLFLYQDMESYHQKKH
jgi:hypothetical protein